MSEAVQRGWREATIRPAIRIARGNSADAWGPRFDRGGERFVPRIAFAKPGAASLSPVVDLVEIGCEAARELPAREKAAFTLRLDPVRHARLKHACNASSRSAQQVVTQALDAFLAAAGGAASTPSLAGAPRIGGI